MDVAEQPADGKERERTKEHKIRHGNFRLEVLCSEIRSVGKAYNVWFLGNECAGQH